MNRFYKMVTTSAAAGDTGYEILLDGKPVKTPSKASLLVPNEGIANEIVLEWAAQKEKINPNSMPLTQILTTKIDRVRSERKTMTQTLMKYIDTDLVCYFADKPPELSKRQEEAWRPALDWFQKKFGIALQTTTGLQALTQDEKAHEEVLEYLNNLNEDQFTIVQLVTSVAGSLVLGMMFTDKEINAKEVFHAIRIEERFQAKKYDEEKYGPDPAEAKKDAEAMEDLMAAQSYLSLLE